MIAVLLIHTWNFPGVAAADKPAWQNGISTWDGRSYQSPAIADQAPQLTLPAVDNRPPSYTLPSDPSTSGTLRAMSAQHFAKNPTSPSLLASPPIQKPLTLPREATNHPTASTRTSSNTPLGATGPEQPDFAYPGNATALRASTKGEQEASIPMTLSSLPNDGLASSANTNPKSLASENADDNSSKPLHLSSPKMSQDAEASSSESLTSKASGSEVDSNSSPADTDGSKASTSSDLKSVAWGSPESAPLQTEVTRWYQYPREWIKGWNSHAEFGLDGSDGNANTLAMQAGLELKRKTKVYTLGMDINYRQASSRNTTTEQNGRFNVNFDRLLGKTSWSAFAKHGMEWDKFKPFDLRLNLNGGFGYYWIRSDTSTFATRFGAGASREIGAPIDNWIPEAVFGMEAERQLTARQKLKGKFDYFPAWENFGDYRLVSDVSWQILLDGSENLSLKLAATDRYDSTPQGAKPNDIYYSLLLLYKF